MHRILVLLLTLFVESAAAVDEGFLATYFSDTLVGAARTARVGQRVDPVIDFDFTQTPPPGVGRTTDFSVRWKGNVRPAYSEAYTLYTHADDGVRVWIDGRLVIDNWTHHAPVWNRASVDLEAGRTYTLQVEYFQGAGGSLMRLLWGSASQPTDWVRATPAGARLDPVLAYDRAGHTSDGDTFYTAWAADGTHFLMTDDTRGFNGDLASVAPGNTQQGRNATVNTLAGAPGQKSFVGRRLVGETDSMAFLKGNDEAGPGLPHGGIWKGSGLGAIDGMLYMTVNDQTRAADQKVVATGASILMSTDGGQNWHGHAPDHVKNAAPLPFMFQDRRFSRINFVQYGQDGRSPDGVHDSHNYVYATSNGGEWDNGSDLYIGRVLRTRLPYNQASDWEFHTGSVDGVPRWGALADSRPIFSKPGKVGQTQMVWVPAIRKYVLPNWYYVRPAALAPTSPDYYGAASTPHTRWEFFMADAPWGPWQPAEPFFVKEWTTEGFYNPSIPNKFMDGKSLWLLFAGNYWDGSLYGLHYARLTLD